MKTSSLLALLPVMFNMVSADETFTFNFDTEIERYKLEADPQTITPYSSAVYVAVRNDPTLRNNDGGLSMCVYTNIPSRVSINCIPHFPNSVKQLQVHCKDTETCEVQIILKEGKKYEEYDFDFVLKRSESNYMYEADLPDRLVEPFEQGLREAMLGNEVTKKCHFTAEFGVNPVLTCPSYISGAIKVHCDRELDHDGHRKFVCKQK